MVITYIVMFYYFTNNKSIIFNIYVLRVYNNGDIVECDEKLNVENKI